MVPSGFKVARDGTSIYIQASGLANMRNAPLLDAFLQAEAGPGFEIICVDLAECTGMDSTFMGLLVGSSAALKSAGGRLVVLNPSEVCTKLLDMLGVSQVLPVIAGRPLPAIIFVDLGDSTIAVGAMQRMEVIRRAHHALISVNEANHQKFGAFIAALEADLAKLSGS